MDAPEHLMTAREVARYLQVSDRKFEQMIGSDEAPAHLKIGRLRRWRPETLKEWLSDQATTTRNDAKVTSTSGEQSRKP